MFAIQRLVKYICIQETHYIVPLIRSSPIENKLQCVVLLRFANCISSALQKPIEIKCKLHDETHDTLSLIRLTLHYATKSHFAFHPLHPTSKLFAVYYINTKL